MIVSLKEGALVAVTQEDGSVPAAEETAGGLYYHDTRYLSVFELRLNGQQPLLLSANADENYVATFQLINPRLPLPDRATLPAQSLSIRRTRFLSDGWHERIGILNCSAQPVTIDLELLIDADFRDMFAVRGYIEQEEAAVERRPATWGVDLRARGRDGLLRETRVRAVPRPTAVTDTGLRFSHTLRPQEIHAIEISITPYEDGRPPVRVGGRRFDRAVDAVRVSYRRYLRSATRFASSHESFDRELVQRGALDLRALLDFETSGPFPTAGIPWYAAPFGRDALIAGLQTLCLDPEIAVGTLRLLAAHQGRRTDPFTEEEPGKIFHELRRGELARLGKVPHTPYYGSVDATPLFVCLFAETCRWLDDRALFEELLPAALAALRWCEEHGDADGDGFVEYAAADTGLRNKGWKDSVDSLSYRDGSPAALPAALAEVQAYVYAARSGLAELCAHWGHPDHAARLASAAERLRERFEEAFWMPQEGCYAQALDAGKRQVDAVSSNAGQVLWGGVASAERAARVVERLMAPDMFTGWGIRTLSSTYPTYNPMSYHNGSVWPHDNSLIAAGFAAYGHRDAANAVIGGIVEAGLRFPNGRLPELFCGFSRDLRYSSRPADYVVSCIPQAWSAGTPFLFIRTMLGLRVDLERGRLVTEPALPEWLRYLDVRGLRAAGRRHTFRVRATRGGIRISGDLARPRSPLVAS